MRALTLFALAEFGKAFSLRKRSGRRVGTPTARDFLWLTIFFALCAFMLFLGISAHDGIWQRFEQVLLGALPGSGPPVRVNHHFVERPEKISSNIIDLFDRQFRNYSIVPMRHFDGKSGTVVLPGLSVPGQSSDAVNLPIERQRENERKIDEILSWGLGKDGSNTPLRIFAMPTDAPVWRWAVKGRELDAAPFPMTIVASRTLFAKHFRYENYRAAVTSNQYVPCEIRSALPAQLKDVRDLTSLVLEVKEGHLRTAFHQFKVNWIDSFPLPDLVAFIMPLSTVELLVATDGRPKLDLNLESGGRPSERIRQVWIRDVEGDAVIQNQFRAFAQCLGAAPLASAATKSDLACGAEWDRNTECETSETCVVPRRRGDDNDLMVTASRSWPLRRGHVAACAVRSELGDILSSDHPLKDQISIVLNDKTARFSWVGPGRIGVPCEVLVESDFVGERNRTCAEATVPGGDTVGVAWLSGYTDAMVYGRASDPGGSLKKAGVVDDTSASPSVNPKVMVSALLGWQPDGSPVFSLDSGYESALVRFGVLSTLIDYITWPLAVGLLLLSLVLSYVILATAFQHRRAQYGLLEMIGVCPYQIHYVVSVQIVLSCLIGCIAGYTLFAVAASGVEWFLAISDVVDEARQLIGFDVQRFLGKLSIATVIWTWIGISGASCALGWGLMVFLLGVSGKKAPIELVKS